MCDWNGRQIVAFQWSRDGFGKNLRPQRLRLPVKQQHVAVVEQARYAELERLPRHVGFERNAGAAKRAIRNGDIVIAEPVVDDFMPVHNAHGVGFADAIVRDRQDTIIFVQRARQ